MTTHKDEWEERIKREVVGMEHPEIYRRTCSFITQLLASQKKEVVEKYEIRLKALNDAWKKQYAQLMTDVSTRGFEVPSTPPSHLFKNNDTV